MTSCAPSPAARRLLPVLVAAALMLVPTAAGASVARTTPEQQRIKALQAQQNAVRSQKATSAAKVNALKASDSQIKSALGDLSENVDATSAQLQDAQQAVSQAESDEAAAKADVASAESKLGDLRTRIRQQAVDAFVQGEADDGWSIFSSQSAVDATNRQTILEFRSSRSLDSLENYRSIQEDLGLARQRAASAADRAHRHQSSVSSKLASLKAAQQQQQQFADQVDRRIDQALAEADSLASVDSTLSSQIVAQQSALAAQVSSVTRRQASSGKGGAPVTFANAGGAGIVNVQGIQVASSIASNLNALLNAAAAAGVVMSGGGYRDPAAQIALRRAHCGSSNYAIYQAPASSCSPPTAQPGRSMHERGLAVDFTQNGSTITRGSTGFAWLSAHAASYGFYNLPSEPWHWSVNGD